MTRQRLLGALAVVVLLAVIIVEGVFLLQTQRELKRYRASDARRRDFCLAYSGMITAVRYGLNEAHDTTNDQTNAWAFVWLTNPAFLKVCNVEEPTRSKIADRSHWGCTRDRAGGGGTEYDLSCLASLAEELEPAISLSHQRNAD